MNAKHDHRPLWVAGVARATCPEHFWSLITTCDKAEPTTRRWSR